MSAQDQPLESSALVPLPRGGEAHPAHRDAQPQVSDAEVKAHVMAKSFAALHQVLHGGPGPLGVKGGR